jgi:hypothetical protein
MTLFLSAAMAACGSLAAAAQGDDHQAPRNGMPQTDARVTAVFLAQTHVMQPEQPFFRLTGNRPALLNAHVVSPTGGPAPDVVAIIHTGSATATLRLDGPTMLPRSITSEPGLVQHRLDDAFTAVIPARLVRPGLVVEVRAGSSMTSHDVAVGAPTVVRMQMFDVHYFGRGKGDYPPQLFQELESKWPVAGLHIERVVGIRFPELVIPARPDVKLPPVRVTSPEDYREKTGGAFDGEQAAALHWVHALSAAGGNGDVAMCYVTIQGVPAGGQAGNYNGVGGLRPGITHHELGHALGLPHNADDQRYPYHGEMYGIPPPAVSRGVHVGPTWAFDLPSRTFIPPTVQEPRGKWVAGTYKADPMQGGGDGDQEWPFLLRHFSDANVRKMQAFLERKVAVHRDGGYFKWDDATGDYTAAVAADGVRYPVERDVPVISVMAATSLAHPDVTMVYPPIGPYRGNRIRTFDPQRPEDRGAAATIFAPPEGCDFTLRITQGGSPRHYLLPVSGRADVDPLSPQSLSTAAVNLRAEDGEVTAVQLLHTPDAERDGLPEDPAVLAEWFKG